MFLLGFEDKRCGVGDPVGELLLVDVKADAADSLGYVAVADLIGDEDAADFAVADIDVVRPLDEDFLSWEQFDKAVGDGDGEGHAEEPLVGEGEEGRFKD